MEGGLMKDWKDENFVRIEGRWMKGGIQSAS
jgi:hypothetical protein